jgi:NAD dependent epimerase/dehydratase family enzyme
MQLLTQASPRRGRAGLPRWILRRQVGVLADFVHSRQRVVPQRALDSGFVFSRPDPLESVRATLARHAAAETPRRSLGAVLQRISP